MTKGRKIMQKAVLFIHGLGGGKDTWGNFESFVKLDNEIEYEPFFYVYPTKAVRIPLLQKKYGKIQSLSKGLKTYIDHRLDEYGEIALVGHSLGGLVIRQYLLDEKISSSPSKIKKVIFYAVPQEGSFWAKISSFFSFNHKQVEQLTNKSEFLDTLNDQWGSSGIANDFEFKIVLALEDGAVSPESAKSNFRSLNIEHIPNTDHRSVVKPQTIEDLSFLILKKFLKKKLVLQKIKLEDP